MSQVQTKELQVGEVVIFDNDNRQPGSKQPHFWGYMAGADGKMYRVALWKRTSKKNESNYLKGKVTPREPDQSNETDPFTL